MKKLALALIAACTLLSGCVVYDTPARYHEYGWRDRDHDGVPNRYDRYPNDPRWR